MSPMNNDDYTLTISAPRTGGDEPTQRAAAERILSCSPHRRG